MPGEQYDQCFPADQERMSRVLRGERPLDWEVWSLPLVASQRLTEKGRACMQWAVNALGEYLGTTFLQRVKEKDMSLPLFQLAAWPCVNQAPWIYADLFELAAQITLFRQRLDQVQAEVQKDLQVSRWAHLMLQLEVGGLASQAGWEATFEPELGTGSKADVRIERGDRIILIETVSVDRSMNEQ